MNSRSLLISWTWHSFAIVLGSLYCLIPSHSMAAQRIALVIGNDTYQYVGALQNARSDARAVATALEASGFRVTLRLDVNREGIEEAMRTLKGHIALGDEAVFYFSGHAVQLGAANYLLPVDIKGESEEQVKDDALGLQRVLDDLQDRRAGLFLAIIDACRGSPFKGTGHRGIGGRGLAPTGAATGQMVFYSAGAGQTSLDSLGESDRGANGLFTRVLLAEMQIPGIPVDRMLRNVRDEVARLAKGAGHDQVPALYDQAPGDFYLRPLATGTVAFGIPKLAHGTLRSDGAMEEEKTQALAAVAPEPPVGTHAGSMDASGLQAQDGNTQGFRDCAECPVLARIPAGNFEMGAPSHEVGRFDSEGPIHRVNVQGFALARTHVTRGEFSDFVDATGYPAGNSCFAFEGGQFEDRPNRSWRDPGFRQDNTHPAVCINWSDAKAYADWLSRKTGKSYRLPTEAEWEYAARAGTTTARYWGENPDLACTYANVGDQAAKSIVPVADVHNCSDGYAYTSPAGSFKPNAFGLYDMLGNAMQWTEDCHHENYDGAPADARAWAGGDCKMRELRGGSWFDLPRFVRAANRGGFDAAKRASVIGFRVARTLP